MHDQEHKIDPRGIEYDRPDWNVRIRNGSEQPVYAVEYHVATSELPQGKVGGAVLEVVPPHSEGDYPPPSATAQWADLGGNAGMVLVFTDAACVRWKREKSGLLTETTLGPQQISSPQPP